MTCGRLFRLPRICFGIIQKRLKFFLKAAFREYPPVCVENLKTIHSVPAHNGYVLAVVTRLKDIFTRKWYPSGAHEYPILVHTHWNCSLAIHEISFKLPSA